MRFTVPGATGKRKSTNLRTDFPQASQRLPDPAAYVADGESCGTAAMSELQKPLPGHQFSGGKGRANAQQFYREVQLQVKPGRLAPG
jgi:hypothetical protein